jgi:cytochrome b pre-mRNA-processing protein 3
VALFCFHRPRRPTDDLCPVALGREPTFATWAQITFLHLYILFVRTRMLPADKVGIWQRHLIDHFFYAADDRMILMHKFNMKGQRQKYTNDLFLQWRGALVAYDEGLLRGDAFLAAALWRNPWTGAEVDGETLALVTAWMRKMLKVLEELDDEQFMQGAFEWVNPESLRELVRRKGVETKLDEQTSSP